MFGKLYIVATPIGNMHDITYRALQCLKTVSLIMCEDMREAHNLLAQYDIKNKIGTYNGENNDIEHAVNLLETGFDVALISDRGTPCVSDPGYELINLCAEKKIQIAPVPGSCAVTALMSVSGFGGKFLFYGFLPKTGCITIIRDLHSVFLLGISVVFFESAVRLHKTLRMIAIELGKIGCENIMICLGRELTKKFETIYRGSLSDSIFIESLPKKGEYTFVLQYKR